MFWSSTTFSLPEQRLAPRHWRWLRPERPRYGWPRWPGRAACATTAVVLPLALTMRRSLPACLALYRPRHHYKQVLIHRTSNHLFDEGKKDVAGKSHDSCTQAEVHRPGRGAGRREGDDSLRAHPADAGTGAERLL